MPYEQLEKLGLSLPGVPAPGGDYMPCVRLGDVLYLSGQGPFLEDGTLAKGKLGEELSVEDGVYHAQRSALMLLAVLEQAAGSLDRVVRIVKVFGMVNAVPQFTQHPAVIDGCSTLLGQVLGERGRHARSAVGMGSLPGNISVEVELIAEVRGSD